MTRVQTFKQLLKVINQLNLADNILYYILWHNHDNITNYIINNYNFYHDFCYDDDISIDMINNIITNFIIPSIQARFKKGELIKNIAVDNNITNILKENIKLAIPKGYKSEFISEYIKYFTNVNIFKKVYQRELSIMVRIEQKQLYEENSLEDYDSDGEWPDTFINLDDKKGDIVTSCISPFDYSAANRTSPLVIIDNEVLLGSSTDHHATIINNFQRKKYKEFTGEEMPTNKKLNVAYERGYNKVMEYFQAATVGVGSSFSNNKVALLEYVTGTLPERVGEGENPGNDGNYQQIVNALKAAGFEKVYINNDAAWSSRNYLRLARLYHKMKK